MESGYNRGICMWSAENEWCGTPLAVEDYHGRLNMPDGYEYGHLYGIHVKDGMPSHNSFWVCDDHRYDFLKLNKGHNGDTTIWQFDNNGIGTDVTWTPTHEVSVRITTHLDAKQLSGLIKGYLMDVLEDNADIEGWKYLKVVSI